tara:strand:+ start:245 stop:538 length:294 start_codon:yes stop_codon:yes gene_type:complete
MKMNERHWDGLQACIKHYLDNNPSTPQNYANGVFPRQAQVHDLNRRYRWDLFYHATANASGLRSQLAQYSSDHIDTALRHLVEPIERNYDRWPLEVS